MTFDSIEIHATQAAYYRFRTPYLDDFFTEISKHLQLDKQSVLLDLCCGGGELSAGLSADAGRIYALDGSAEMLARAPKLDNVTYHRCDINEGSFICPTPVDHIVIGRAVHWITSDALRKLCSANLAEHSRILVCSTQQRPVGDWYDAYWRVAREYQQAKSFGRLDFSGSETLGRIGFQPTHRINVAKRARCDIAYLVRNAMANAYADDLDRLVANADLFHARLTQELAPFTPDGMVEMQMESWAISYCMTAA